MPIVIPEMTPQQQAEAVISTESREHERPRKPGDRVFLISSKWFAAWCDYTGHAYDPQQRKLLGTNNSNTADNDQDVFSSIPEEKPRPGPIDCSDLLDPAPVAGDLSPEELALATPLRLGLKEKENFWILHEATWQLLKNWYGCTGPEIFREYIAVGIQRRLEVHHDQWQLKAVDEHSGRTVVIPALRMSTVAALKDAVCAALETQAEEVELASYPGMRGEPQLLEDKMLKTLVGVHLQDHQAILIRRKDHPDVAAAAAAAKRMALMQTPTSSIPRASTAAIPMSIENINTSSTPTTTAAAAGTPALTLPSSISPIGPLSPKYKIGTSPANLSSSPLSRSFSKAPSWAEDAIIPSSNRRPGLAGLGNLGNTCFMNSSLQCLVHSMPLMRTFLTGAYRADLNRDNPLGLGGKLAAAFGGLMGKLWQGGVGHVSPKHFKWQLGKFAPQFGGYAQQDSQELLAFLLDGLHEDLNRIAVKPYREEKDDDGRPDAEVAAEAWDNYRARNDSVIVDHFQGLYKSSLRCPECGRTSVKFDPFMYLSLPLPTPKTRTLTVIIVDAAGAAAPLQVSVEVMKTGTIGDVLEKVAACCATSEVESEEWLLAQWTPSGYDKLILFRDPKLPVSSIKEPAKSTSLFSSSKPATLIAYRYSSDSSSTSGAKSRGPTSGFRPIVVFHKAKYILAGAPTVLYLPTKSTAPSGVDATDDADAEQQQQELEELAIERQKLMSSRWILTSPNTIQDALASFMKPFVKPGVDTSVLIKGTDGAVAEEQPMPMQEDKEGTATTAAVANAVDGGEDVGMTDADPTNQSNNTDNDTTTISIEGVNEIPAAAAAAAAAAASDENTLPASVPDVDPFLFASETTTEVDIMAVDGDSQQASAANTTNTSLPSPPAVPPARPGVGLFLAKPNGDLKTGLTLAPSLDKASIEEPLCFLIEWSDEIVAESMDLTPWTSPVVHESAVAAGAAAAAPPRPVTLDDCVDTFLQPEKLDASDSWYCTGCKSHVQAEKKLDLWRLPEVLVVHLKRFSYSRYSRDKLDTEVDFPLQGLDLRNVVPVGEGGTRVMDTTTKPSAETSAPAPTAASATTAAPVPPAPVYDLYAVSNHYGGLGGGHYTAYCQMPDDGKWYTFDDSSVIEMNPAGVKSTAAYVLFYRRRGAEAKDGDIERIIEAARANGDDDSLTDVDLFTGGFGSGGASGSGAAGQLTPRRTLSQQPTLEQVTEEGDEENVLGVVAATGAGDGLALDDVLEDDDADLPDLLPSDAAATTTDVGADMGFSNRGILQQQQHQPSLSAHALPLEDLDDVVMDDI